MQLSASVLLNRLLSRGKFRHVQILLKVAELGSLQRTADAVGMTQSSVTQSLAYLEKLLGTPLFERHARGMRPTAICSDLLPVARRLLLGLGESAEVIAASHSKGQGIVRMLASVSAIHGLLVNALPAFADANPAITVHLTEAEGDDQLAAIARSEVDLVACRRPAVTPEGWRFSPILEDRLVVVCGATHALTRARRLDWSQLARDHTWALAPAGSAVRDAFDALMQPVQATGEFTPRTHPIVTRSPTMMRWLLQRSPVIALLPISFARAWIDAGELKALDVELAHPMQPLGLLAPSFGTTPAAEALSDALTQAFARSPASHAPAMRRRAQRKTMAL